MALPTRSGTIWHGGCAGTVSAASAISVCTWQAAGGGEAAAVRIAEFLVRIGVTLAVGAVTTRAFVPGIVIRNGTLLIDPAVPAWPGDLLHEAGHIAVTDPAQRAALSDVPDDPGEEMAAIAWSWAAAQACGVAADHLFHAEGYRGGGGYLTENFTAGRFVGVPMLAWWGMCSEAVFPQMQRWLR